MDYEKKYKDLLDKAKKLHDENWDECKVCLESLFPELAESEDERIRKKLIKYFQDLKGGWFGNISHDDILAWLEKQGKQASVIRWYDVSLIPQEMEELLVEWDSEDATWHEIAFYHADTKTFWDGTRQVENVTRWCYIDDILEKQAPKSKWSDDEQYLLVCKNALRKYQVSDKWDAEIISKWLENKLKH